MSDARGCLLFDLTGRGEIVLTGKDRVELLHGLVTNDIKKLAPGTGCYAAFLTPKGKLLADLTVLRHDDRLVIDCEPTLAAKVAGLIPKYVFFQEVFVEDRTAERAVFHVEGPEAATAVAGCGFDRLPSEEHGHVTADWNGEAVTAVAERRGGGTGFDLRLSRAVAPALEHALEEAGVTKAPPEVLEAARIEAGIPRWGAELDESVLPNEAGMERTAISYTKGCYIGQEIVARIKTYGHVNRLLVALMTSPTARIGPGAEVFSGDSKVGSVTSAAVSSRRGRTVALGYVKRDAAKDGTPLTIAAPGGPEPAVVALLPLAG